MAKYPGGLFHVSTFQLHLLRWVETHFASLRLHASEVIDPNVAPILERCRQQFSEYRDINGDRLRSTGRFQEVEISHTHYETCKGLYDSVMLHTSVLGGVEDSCQGESEIGRSIGEASG